MPSLAYLLKSVIILAVLLIYYSSVLKKQTFFNLNRIYLAGALIMAVFVPLIHIELAVHENVSRIYTLQATFFQNIEAAAVPEQNTTFGLYHYFSVFYWSGVLFFSLKYLIFWIQIVNIVRKFPHKKLGGIHVFFLPESCPTFSLFHCLFLNDKGLNKENRRKILEHEKIHIRQLHSLDIHFSSILCIFNWFNPLVWIFKKLIAQNHEYIADKQVIERFQTGSYLQLLVDQTLQGKLPYCHGFSCSNLKKRMIMMTQKQTKKYKVMSYIPALFISGALFFSFTCTATGIPSMKKPANFLSRMISSSPIEAQDSIDNNEIFQVVEKMPAFKGNLQKWLSENLKYPPEAKAKKIEGKVFVKYIITKTGEIKDAKISKSAHPLLDAEALRFVNSMPAWEPGKQKGQAVNVAYVLPIHFSLSSKDSSKPAASEKGSDAIFEVVEKMPQFSEGNVVEWLGSHMQYPEDIKGKGPVKVYIQFTIGKDGNLSDFKIVKSSNYESADQEAMRVIKAMPAWKPGQQRGQAVAVRYCLPVTFQ